jgi:hypothetical protein
MNVTIILLRVFVAALTFLPSRCLTNDITDTCTCIQTDWRAFMKYVVELGSDAK